MRLQEIVQRYFESLQEQERPSFFPRISVVEEGTIIQFNRDEKMGMGVVSDILGEYIKLMWLSEQTWLASEKDYFLEEDDTPLALPLICCTWLILWIREDDIISNFGKIDLKIMKQIKTFSSNSKSKAKAAFPYLHLFILGDEPVNHSSELLVRVIEVEEEQILIKSGSWILSPNDPRSWLQEQLKEYFLSLENERSSFRACFIKITNRTLFFQCCDCGWFFGNGFLKDKLFVINK